MIYQKAVPEDVFSLIMEMVSKDVSVVSFAGCDLLWRGEVNSFRRLCMEERVAGRSNHVLWFWPFLLYARWFLRSMYTICCAKLVKHPLPMEPLSNGAHADTIYCLSLCDACRSPLAKDPNLDPEATLWLLWPAPQPLLAPPQISQK